MIPIQKVSADSPQLLNLRLWLTLQDMISFFIKKAFFDGWDNLLGIFVFNLAYVALLVIGLAVFSSMGSNTALYLLLFLAFIFVVAVCMGGSAGVVFNYSNYTRDSWQAFRDSIGRNIRHSVLYALVMAVFFLNIVFTIPFYLSSGSLGLLICIVLLWLEVLIFIAVPYYFPLMNLLPADRPLKTARKCLIIAADNMGFTIFLAFYNLFCIALSVFTLGLIPGLTGMQLAAQDGMKLLMFKYDWIEKENPDVKERRHAPWADLLYDEKEKVGPRSLKSMIFPWK